LKPIYLKKITACLPERTVTNDEIIANEGLKMKAAWIESRIGIRERRWAAPNQAASDLAFEAVRDLGTGEATLFVSTISPDFLTPSTASILKRKLGWTGDRPATDIAAACAGLVFGFELAHHRLLATEEKNVIVCATEVRSRFLNPKDRRTVFIFGDAACAFWFARESEGSIARLDWTSARTEASPEIEILIPGGGSRAPLTAESLARGDAAIQMVDGAGIESAVEGLLLEKLRQELGSRSETVADYDFFVFHQGNSRMIREVCAALGIRENQTLLNFERYGNSSSASVGVVLEEAARLGRIAPGDRVLMIAMGAGRHLGLCGLTWNA
jgi:3-oxoacyl-(acyl-carrier-protein) synthase III